MIFFLLLFFLPTHLSNWKMLALREEITCMPWKNAWAQISSERCWIFLNFHWKLSDDCGKVAGSARCLTLCKIVGIKFCPLSVVPFTPLHNCGLASYRARLWKQIATWGWKQSSNGEIKNNCLGNGFWCRASSSPLRAVEKCFPDPSK